MNGAFYIGATGLRSQQEAVDAIANNIANMNTPAYKRAVASFSELVTTGTTQGTLRGAFPSASTLQGVASDTHTRVFTAGDVTATNNPMNLAIKGDGFIELLAPSGETTLWRGGTLQVNTDGYLAAANGSALKAMIAIPSEATGLSISPAGAVTAVIPGQDGVQELGNIELVRINDTRMLNSSGDSIYTVSDEGQSNLIRAQPGDNGSGQLAQGYAEQSNVNLSDEMVSLLLLQRAYGANAQVVQAGDNLMTIANGLKR